MSWKDRAEAYKAAGDVGSMRSDDFIARAILRGLGWTEKGLPLLCSILGLDKDGAKVNKLVLTAIDVLDVVSGGMFGLLSPSRKFIVDVRQLRNTESFWTEDGGEADELCELASGMKGGMICISVKEAKDGDRKCMSYVFLHESEPPPPWILRPTSVLRASRNGMWVWIRDTEKLVRDMADCLGWRVPDPPGK